jgi:hypothetical protein
MIEREAGPGGPRGFGGLGGHGGHGGFGEEFPPHGAGGPSCFGPGMPPPSFPPPPGMGPGYSLEQLPLLGPGTPQAGSGAGSLPRTAAPASRAGLQVKEPSQTVS